MSVEVIPVTGVPEVGAGQDLGALLVEALGAAGRTLADGDVLAVTQKAVSKAEGRVVPLGPGGKEEWVARETRRVVARRGELVIARTRHGFVCANAGVDQSNVAEGFVCLLPEDPDASAERIRRAVREATGARVGVVVTDTFGRPWRRGLVNVAIGCAGLPALVDLRGTRDAVGRVLDVTVQALADEVAAAAGLVMGKADRVPAAVVRGVRAGGPPSGARALVRDPGEDLFRESPLQAVRALRGAAGPGRVDGEAVAEALAAAWEGAGSDRLAGRVLFVALLSRPARLRVLAALREPAGPEHRDLARAPAIVLPCVRPGPPGDPARDALLVEVGGVVQALRVALRGLAIATRWVLLDAGPAGAVRSSAALDGGWTPVGCLAAGPAPDREPPPADRSPPPPLRVLE